MPELIRLLLIPAFIATGWLVSRRQRTLASGIASGLGALHLALLATLAASGLARFAAIMALFHHRAGLGIFIAAWVAGLFSIGVAIEQATNGRKRVVVARIIVLLLLIAGTFLASVTGYLGPSHDPAIDVEQRNRFVVVHMLIWPLILAVLSLLWCWLFWPGRKREFESPVQAETK